MTTDSAYTKSRPISCPKCAGILPTEEGTAGEHGEDPDRCVDDLEEDADEPCQRGVDGLEAETRTAPCSPPWWGCPLAEEGIDASPTIQ